MEKRNKPIIAVILAVTIILSTTVVSFAIADNDPIGNCIYIPTQHILQK